MIFQKKISPEYWESVTESVKIEKRIIERNRRHLHQTKRTPCTIESFAPLLGPDSFT